MTPFEYIVTNPSYEEARLKWLVFNTADKEVLLAKQATLDTPHRIAPIELTDGRWAVCCDLLTEISGGVFQEIFSILDQSKLNAAVIMEDAEFRTLLPEPDII